MNDIIRPVPQTPKQDPPASADSAPTPLGLTPGVVPGEDVTKPPVQLATSKPKRIWLRWVLGVLGVLLLGVIATAITGYLWYTNALKPVATTMHNQTFSVDQGASVQQIADGLQAANLVRSSLATQIYMRLNHQTSVKAGNYVLSSSQSVSEIASWLNSGHIDTLRVTILPGRTLKDLENDFEQYGYKQADIEAAFNKKWDHPILADKPAGVNLEGYIYPETYFMKADSTPEDLVLRSFDEFEKQVEAKDLRKSLAARGFNLHQGITLASIINAETSTAEDQRKVSQVLQTRLSKGMMLGSDVTYIYAAKQLGVKPSPDLDSPYNTRKVTGLPPGAVGNFNLSVLDAVANPANTTYLFFVAGDDGVTHYAYTYDEHQTNVSKYCQRSCFSN